jgi:hypothetical protein
MGVDLTGPFGGALGAVYALGCVSGWGFAMRQMTARIADLRADCERHNAEKAAEIAGLKADIAKLNDFMMRGMERQLGQIKDSTVRMIDRGRIDPPLGGDSNDEK